MNSDMDKVSKPLQYMYVSSLKKTSLFTYKYIVFIK